MNTRSINVTNPTLDVGLIDGERAARKGGSFGDQPNLADTFILSHKGTIYSCISSCITTLALYATGVPGPKMAATPAL